MFRVALFFTYLFLLLPPAAAQSVDELNQQVSELLTKAAFDSAHSCAMLSLNLAADTYGEETLKYAESLDKLAEVLIAEGEYPEAEKYLIEAKQIRSTEAGEKSPVYIHSVNQLAGLYKTMGRYNEAESLYWLAMKVKEEVIGKEHPSYAVSLNNLAALYEAMGRYQDAERLYLNSLDIWIAAKGKANTGYAVRLTNLAILYHRMGIYKQSEAYYKQALEVWEQESGKNDPRYALTLGGLAKLYQHNGDYRKSETFAIDAANLLFDTVGDDHPEYAKALNNLAGIYTVMGRYDEAEELLKKTLMIQEKSLGDEHTSYAAGLNNLAALYEKKGEFEKAENFYRKAVLIFGKKFGENHPSYAAGLNNIAALNMQQERFDEAERLYRKALDIIDSVFGKENIDYAAALNNLAGLFRITGRLDDAEEYYLEAERIWKKKLGTRHPDFAINQLGIAMLRVDQKRFDEAEPCFTNALDNYKYQIEYFFPSMSEKEKMQFYNTVQESYNVYYAFAVQRAIDNPRILAEMYDNRLFTKAILFLSAQRIRDRIYRSNDSLLIERYEQWLGLREYLSRLYTVSEDVLNSMDVSVDSLEKAANTIEKELSLASESFAHDYEQMNISWKDIRQRLKQNEAAAEIIRFGNEEEVHYAILYITRWTEKNPGLIFLDDGNALEAGYMQMYMDYVFGKKIDEEKLYHVYWGDVAEQLKGIEVLYLSLDGVYNEINLLTLKNPATNKYVLDETDIRILTNTNELVMNPMNISANNKAVLFGAPDFFSGENKKSEIVKQQRLAAGLNIVEVDNEDEFLLSPLPGTKEEVNSISTLLTSKGWEVKSYFEQDAFEENVKAIDNPKLLHIATHGYFEREVNNDKAKEEHPLLRSYLFFTGSGSAMKNRKQNTFEKDDGILTAFEAMNLNLTGTELVVLSACETGLGEMRGGEGVYGLQRAFRQAGAQTVMMSLWTIDDNTTRELMEIFYKEWLGGAAKHSALRKAMMTIREKYPLPFYWGGFVLVGI